MMRATTTATSAAAVPQALARGTNGQIAVHGQYVTIRKGLVTRQHGIRGERHVAASDIAAVQLEPATSGQAGSLRLLLRGEEVASSERTVLFAIDAAAQFEEVHARLEALVDATAGSSRS